MYITGYLVVSATKIIIYILLISINHGGPENLERVLEENRALYRDIIGKCPYILRYVDFFAHIPMPRNYDNLYIIYHTFTDRRVKLSLFLNFVCLIFLSAF